MDCDDHSDQITAMKREFDERVILDLKEQFQSCWKREESHRCVHLCYLLNFLGWLWLVTERYANRRRTGTW